mmetsp:Transcript_4961/g.12775  ORF Transcript_4961/g.12775 Transcript_4961/m.12775 type:complete len:384 (-) Transcript_4961:2872-4023(-)
MLQRHVRQHRHLARAVEDGAELWRALRGTLEGPVRNGAFAEEPLTPLGAHLAVHAARHQAGVQPQRRVCEDVHNARGRAPGPSLPHVRELGAGVTRDADRYRGRDVRALRPRRADLQRDLIVLQGQAGLEYVVRDGHEEQHDDAREHDLTAEGARVAEAVSHAALQQADQLAAEGRRQPRLRLARQQSVGSGHARAQRIRHRQTAARLALEVLRVMAAGDLEEDVLEVRHADAIGLEAHRRQLRVQVLHERREGLGAVKRHAEAQLAAHHGGLADVVATVLAHQRHDGPVLHLLRRLHEVQHVAAAHGALQEGVGAAAGRAAADHDHDAVPELVSLVHVVRREAHDALGAALLEHTPKLAPRVRVHARRRLVQDEHARAAHER